MALAKRFPFLATVALVCVLDAILWFGQDLLRLPSALIDTFGTLFVGVGLVAAVVGWIHVRRADLGRRIAVGALVGTFAAMVGIVLVVTAGGCGCEPS